MSTTPSLALIPSGYKAEKLYSVLPTDGSGDFTVSRASKKHKINSDLKLEIIENNVPALNYDAIGGCPVLNTEPQATNLITYPITFGNSYWTKSGATIQGDPSTAGSALNVSSFVNNNYTTFSDASATGFTATSNGAALHIATSADEISFTNGKQYLVTFDLTLNSGTAPTIGLATSVSGTSGISNVVLSVNGSNSIQLTADSTLTGVLVLYNVSTATDFVISNISVKEVQGYSAPSVDFPTSAFKLVEDAATSVHYIGTQAWATTSLIGQAYTISCFAKKGESNFIQLLFSGATHDASNYANFDLLNGVVGSSSNGVAKIEALADGWYKCSFTSPTINIVATSQSFIWKIESATAVRAESYTGDGISGVYIFMAQAEAGSVATSPTFTDTTLAAEGSTTTRLADVVGGAGDSSTFNDIEGVLFVNISALDNIVNGDWIGINDGGINNRIIIGYVGANTIRFILISGGAFQVDFSETVASRTSLKKCAFRWSLNDCSFWIDGVKVGTDTLATMPVGLVQLSFNDGATANFNGNTKQIQVYKTALSDAELQALTTL